MLNWQNADPRQISLSRERREDEVSQDLVDQESGLAASGVDSAEDSDDPVVKSVRVISCYEDADYAAMPMEDIDEDTLGMSVTSLTLDTYYLSKKGCSFGRVTRLITSLFLVVITIALQVALLYYVKKYVSARQVHNIREAYDIYEATVYGCPKRPDALADGPILNCTLTVNGKHRGKDISWPGVDEAKKRLMTLDGDVRDMVCHIPLSQPEFFSLVLLLWSLTCLSEVRKACQLMLNIVMLPIASKMEDSIEQTDDGEVICKMTRCMKIVLVMLTWVPRVSVTFFLLWVGCRWLLATTAFSDLILNAVALEFILLIKEGLYTAVMPARSHLDLANTKIAPYPREMSAAWFNFTNSISVLFIAMLWVYLYMWYLQAVLPGYRWDIHDVCVEYMEEIYKV